jgi:hypothetical protein
MKQELCQIPCPVRCLVGFGSIRESLMRRLFLHRAVAQRRGTGHPGGAGAFFFLGNPSISPNHRSGGAPRRIEVGGATKCY